MNSEQLRENQISRPDWEIENMVSSVQLRWTISFLCVVAYWAILSVDWYRPMRDIHTTRPTKKNWNFVPFPFVPQPKVQMQCEFMAGRGFLNNNSDVTSYDLIQKRHLAEGYCVPNLEPPRVFHFFSTPEAVSCLRNKTIYFAGDSYTMQTFIGFADVLLGRSDTKEILQGVMRREYLASAEKDLDDARDVNSNFPVVKYVCDPECYGVDWANCSNCFRTFPPSSVDAVVINSEIHSIQELLPSQWTLPAAAAPENLVRVTDLLSGFLMSHRHPFIWVTGPETPVAPYGTAAVDSWAVGGTGPRLYGIPVLDFHNLTTKCTWANCTPDGAHRSRFFCLLKAQILLNTFCEEFM